MIQKIEFISSDKVESIILTDEVIEIFGVKYDYALFRAWSKDGLPIGAKFELTNREDSIISFKRIDNG